MSGPPVPKPRTKFDPKIAEEPEAEAENAENQKVEQELKKTPPKLPPRPPAPAKPPRQQAAPHRLSDLIPHQTSPPPRQAPPPPPPSARPVVPPEVGWLPEVLEEAKKVDEIMSRPLPATPIEVLTIENPMYLSLEKYRTLSGLTPTSDEVEQLREWLSEEDLEKSEEEKPSSSNSNSNSLASPIPVEVRHPEVQDNPYTPCPRRNEFPTSSTTSISSKTSRKSQNIYVSHNELFSPEKPVVESCNSSISCDFSPDFDPEPQNLQISHPYVNIADSDEKSGENVSFVGFVTFLSSFRKEKRVHCRLRNLQISFHEDEETSDFYLGPFDIKDIYTFRILRKKAENGHFMDIASTSSPSSSSTHQIDTIQILHLEKKLQFTPEDPAALWMLLISEAWCPPKFPKPPGDSSIFGRLWIRQGTAGEWAPAIAGVFGRTLVYSLERKRLSGPLSTTPVESVEVDLRKVTTIQEKLDKSLRFSSPDSSSAKSKRGAFSLNIVGKDESLFRSYFLEAKDDNSTQAFYENIFQTIHQRSNHETLEEYRLTSDDIPVLVDKCLRFVDAFGIKSEGIYRRNGKVSEAKIILNKLLDDPVGTHIKNENNETVYAVADVLRQFFRRLADPLVRFEVQKELFEMARIDSPTSENLEEYSRIISKLPIIHQSTLKKLIAHLKNVHEHMEDNKASVENLAKIFGASLFSTDSSPQNFTENYNDQINVIRHFINFYDQIFQISSQEEISRQLLKEAEKKTKNNQKFGAELMVPIHMWEKDNLPFNVKVGLAGEEVCREAIAKNSFDAPRTASYSIFEILCDGQIRRRIPASEKLSKIVMRWIGWKCTDSYLLFDHDKYRFDGDNTSSFTGKVKMAEPGSKSFKSYEMKIEKGASILIYRNEKLYKTWQLDDVIWFVGADSTRKPPNHFNTTAILKGDGGEYCSRQPGYCISFREEEERTRWLNAVNYAQTGGQPENLVFI